MNNPADNNAIVLVVDDSPESLGMLNIALGQAGYTVLVALNGAQALTILEKVEPDVILLDAIMPEMDGFTACKRIQQTHPETPVIFMTGLSEEENIVSGFDAGGVDYITKPIKPNEVIARIRVHVTNARLKSSAHEALDTTGKHILELDDNGNVIWATQQAHELFNTITVDAEKSQQQFQYKLSQWLSLGDQQQPLVFRSQTNNIHLNYLAKQKNQHHLVQLSDHDTGKDTRTLIEKLSVTQREADVLLWISRGKTNREIAQILDISPRTVNKHLEQIFKKLEVDNRTAAAAICLRSLGGTGL